MTTEEDKWWDGAASSFNEPHLAWLHDSAVSFLEMVQIDSESSILDLGCGAILVAQVVSALLSPEHGAIVGIASSDGILQETRRIWEDIGMGDLLTLHHGNVIQLDSITGFHQATQTEPAPTFDYVFARDLLASIPEDQWSAVLQHWAQYRTPDTGRLVMTFGLMDFAGLLLVDGKGQVHERYHLMLESEWARGEQAFRASVTAAGFRLEKVERVGSTAELWIEYGRDLDEWAYSRYAQLQLEGGLEPEWSRPDGGFSVQFKKQLRQEAIEDLSSRIMEALGERRADGMHVVPFAASLAGVVA